MLPLRMNARTYARDTMPSAHASPSHQDLDTVEAASTVLLVFFRIARAWGLSPDEQAILLGVNQATCDAWRDERVDSALPGDTLERLGYILNIYSALQTALPVQERADAWVRAPNRAAMFGGEPVLKRMLSGQVADLKAVADYLAGVHSGDFA